MSELMACAGCGGFMPSTAPVCPHCDARQPRRRLRRVGVLLGLAGSASLGLTMMACYGAPPGERPAEPDGNSDATGADGGAPD